MNHVTVGLSLGMKLWIIKGFHGTTYCIEIISMKTLYLVHNISDRGKFIVLNIFQLCSVHGLVGTLKTRYPCVQVPGQDRRRDMQITRPYVWLTSA
jgi:hypothetical protein